MWLIVMPLSLHNLHLLFFKVLLCCFWLQSEDIQFLFKSFLFLAMFKFSPEISLVCCLKCLYSCFLPFLFSGYFCFVNHCVLNLFSVHCNQSSLVFIIIIIITYSFRVFHISISWWSFTGVWVTASLLKSPGLFSGFWPFSIMQ